MNSWEAIVKMEKSVGKRRQARIFRQTSPSQNSAIDGTTMNEKSLLIRFKDFQIRNSLRSSLITEIVYSLWIHYGINVPV